jgi:hypothetical protein
MTAPVKTTLLALLLTLKNLEDPLSPAEEAALNKVGKQLEANPNAWKVIEKGLMNVIEANRSLNQLYQAAKAQLDAVDGNIPSDLLPTKTELEQALPAASQREKRPWFEGKPDEKSDAILNIAVNILTTPDPADTTKKLSSLEKLWQFLKKSSNK